MFNLNLLSLFQNLLYILKCIKKHFLPSLPSENFQSIRIILKHILKFKNQIYKSLYIYIYIIAEAEKKLISTFKEALTNQKKRSLKCCHVYSFLVKQPHITTFGLSKLLPRLQLKNQFRKNPVKIK